MHHLIFTPTPQSDAHFPDEKTESPIKWGIHPASVTESSASQHVESNLGDRASLVAQWLRVCLPMQETRVRALVWEDPTCRGATGSTSHSY